MPARQFATREVSIFFPVAGIEIEGIYITAGSRVEAGDIIARLYQSGLAEEIEALERSEARIRLQLRHNAELHEYSLHTAEVTGTPVDDTRYFYARQALQAELRLVQAALETLRVQEEYWVVRSPMAGTVVHVMHFTEGDVSTQARALATVADQTLTIYRASHLLAAEVVVGEVYALSFTQEGETYTHRVEAIDPERMGITVTQGAFPEAFFVAVGGDVAEMNPGITGRIVDTLGEARNVLVVPQNALMQRGGRYFVFVMENGVRRIRYVEVGLVSHDLAEIKSGLTLGERVVL
jgi:RND family efflux transporter MFP subunit